MRKRRSILLRFVLTFLLVVQSATFAKAALAAYPFERDSYGSIICTAHKKNNDFSYRHQPVPACCVNGCIYLVVLENFGANDIILKSDLVESTTFFIVLAAPLHSVRFSFVYDARSPPSDSTLI